MRTADDELGDLQAYDDMAARLYGDREIPPGTRELALALAWLQLRDPARHTAKNQVTTRLKRLLGSTRSGEYRLTTLAAEDAPRYTKPRAWFVGSNGPCEGPRVRPYRPRRAPTVVTGTHVYLLGAPTQLPPQSGSPVQAPPEPGPLVCGAPGQIRVAEYDLATGQLSIIHWFCRRHKEHADRVREQLAARGEIPTPIPNTGGFLPRYFLEPGLIRLYAECRPGWEPPVYGICRDDWPTAAPTLAPKRPRLAVVVK